MKNFMKWTGIAVGGLIGLALLSGLILYSAGMKKLTQTYPNIAVETASISAGADAVARGRHIAVVWSCTKCHGENLAGRVLTGDPIMGAPILATIPSSNLTSGRGGIAKSYTNTDWIRAIRNGVKPDNRVEVFMDASYSTMSDRDLGDLIAYLKQLPPVDSEHPAARLGPIVPVAAAVGLFAPSAEKINHRAPHRADPAPGATVAYGRYLSATCAACHGQTVARELRNWKEDDFVRALRTGVLPNGRHLGPAMSSRTFGEMTDVELTALWLYFSAGKR